MVKDRGIYKRGDIWWVSFTADGRQIRESSKSTSKKVAEKLLAKRRVNVAENRFLDFRKSEKIKFEDFANEYLEVHAKNKRSYHSDLDTVKVLNRFFAGKFLHEITPFLVEKFKTERAREVSGATVNRNLACLKCMFNKAIMWSKFNGKNPVKGISLFKEQQRLRFLEKEEIEHLLRECAEHLRPIVTTALHTGMRRGEILNLKWHDCDFRRDIIYLYNTKNGERREIPMNDTVRKTLIGVPKHPESPYIFCNKDGQPYVDIKKSFFTACKNSGIIKNSGFRFHDLRHTFASQMRMSGVDLADISEFLGHKSLQMTKRYAHLSPDYKKRAFDLLSQKIDSKFITNLSQSSKSTELSTEAVFDNSLEHKELVNT